jgi:hypothetical protein
MTASKPPYLPFYGRDFYDDDRVAQMSYHEQGIYLRLLWHQWVNGSLPASPDDLARIVLEPVPERVLACFPVIGDTPGLPRAKPGLSPGSDAANDDLEHTSETSLRRANPRLMEERKRVLAGVRAKQRGGKLGRRKQLQAAAKPGDSPGIARAKPRVSPGKAGAKPGHPDPDPYKEDLGSKRYPDNSVDLGKPRSRRGTGAVAPVRAITWSARVIDTWNAVAGAAPAGHLVGALKPVYDEVGDVDRLCYGLAKWLLAGNAKFGPSVFARDWRSWVPGGREHVPRLGDLAVEEFVAQVKGDNNHAG